MTDLQVDNAHPGAHMEAELASQSDAWERAAALIAKRAVLPARGERIAVVGCGTSWFMAQSWAESYPAKEYRHGPIAIAAPGRVTWMFGKATVGLAADIASTGAYYEHRPVDAMADLFRASAWPSSAPAAPGSTPTSRATSPVR